MAEDVFVVDYEGDDEESKKKWRLKEPSSGGTFLKWLRKNYKAKVADAIIEELGVKWHDFSNSEPAAGQKFRQVIWHKGNTTTEGVMKPALLRGPEPQNMRLQPIDRLKLLLMLSKANV